MNKIEIINETAKYYSKDTSRRAYGKGNCHYYLKEEEEKVKKCAVGRCMNEKGIKKYGDSGDPVGGLFIMEGDSFLKPKYRGHDRNFWSDLQYFHDLHFNWGENKLSEQGEMKLRQLLEKYKN